MDDDEVSWEKQKPHKFHFDPLSNNFNFLRPLIHFTTFSAFLIHNASNGCTLFQKCKVDQIFFQGFNLFLALRW
jgi:hypothetical protein